MGRWVTVAGVLIGIGTSFLAAGFSNISNYFQVLFSFLNVPLFTAFIIGMFWRRASSGSGFWVILIGTIVSIGVYVLYQLGVLNFRSDLRESLWGAILAFVAGALAIVIVSSRQPRKSDEELHGLVYGLEIRDVSETEASAWYRSPVILGCGVLAIAAAGYVFVYTL